MERIPIRHMNATQKEPDLSENFSIRDIPGLLAGKDMVQELHRHDFFYILALKNATGDHEIDFTPYTVGDNSVFFMRPGQVHQLVLKAESTGYLMQFKAEFYFPQDKISNQLFHKASQTSHYQLTDDGFQKLSSILTYILQEGAEKKERYEEVIKANMGIFFIELARQQGNSSRDQAGLYMQERLEEFLSLLETHIFTHKQVAEYAAMLHLSTYQLNSIVKAVLDKTCSALINEHIVLETKRYLLATSNQVSQIAYHLGFEDVSYFIRFFKKHTGYSPELFRHNFR